jgi:hypothetical protein
VVQEGVGDVMTISPGMGLALESIEDPTLSAASDAEAEDALSIDIDALDPLEGDEPVAPAPRAAEPKMVSHGPSLTGDSPTATTSARVAGDLEALVRTVAVCGGAGDDLFDDVRRAEADVFVTADLRHHPASESLAHGSPALVDCAHWATEWPWLGAAEALMTAELAARGTTVETRVSHLVTDPWSSHLEGTTPTTGEPR